MRPLLMSLAIILCFISPILGAAGGAKDQQFLQGTWIVVSMHEGGEGAPEELLKTLIVVIAKDRLTIKDKNKDKTVTELSFKMDPAARPKSVDFTFLDGRDKGKTELGIYAFEGDKVRFCVGGPGKSRPADFASPKGSDIGLIVLKRQ